MRSSVLSIDSGSIQIFKTGACFEGIFDFEETAIPKEKF
jgi:hypothetical protein